MSQAWLDFYISLPKISDVKSFYVRGYTETLHLFPGVRVVLDGSFVNSIGSDKKVEDCFRQVKFPCYFIPIVKGMDCLGFVLKGHGKPTPSYKDSFYLPLVDLVDDNSVVYLVEGFKDAYLLLMAGCCCIPMLTSVPSPDLLKYFNKKNCLCVFISDNDEHREIHQFRFAKHANAIGLKYMFINFSGQKDLGEFFDDPRLNVDCRTRSVRIVKNIIRTVKDYQLKSN